MRRSLAIISAATLFSLVAAAPAFACGGLVNPNGTVSLVKTTTLAGYRWGVEHYITGFKFDGGGAKFGSIIPIPAVPSKIKAGGAWTLKRLVQEVTPPTPQPAGAPRANDAGGGEATVVKEKRIGSARVQILKGGGDAVGRWAKNNGFALPPDAPEVLDFYAARSPYFMALRFIPSRSEEQNKGDVVPIHLFMRVDNPWVPLRILALGQSDSTVVEADVFLLTKNEPNLLPEPAEAGSEKGTVLERSEQASQSLLNDLRTDKVKDNARRSMNWVHPSKMWLTYLRLNVDAQDLTYDLATNVRGGEPSAEDAGERPEQSSEGAAPVLWTWGMASFLGLASITMTNKLVGRGS